MKDLKGKVVVVTGAASGIGFALARRFADEGMRVVLADIEAPALRDAHRRITEAGGDAIAVETDVAQEPQVMALARRTLDQYGGVHALANCAGVATIASMWGMTDKDWRWISGVNLGGVINGIRAFVPLFVDQEEGYVINASSVIGLSSAGWGAYSVTKHAIVACSEALYHGLANQGSKVKVSVLCPGWTKTRLIEAERNRPADLQNAQPPEVTPQMAETLSVIGQAIEHGMDSADVAAKVIEAMAEERFYIFTHPDTLPLVQFRYDDIFQGRNPTPLF